jgi:hypothetical protein
MKNLLSILLAFLFFAAEIFAADSTNAKIIFKPIGFRPNNQMLEGGFSSDISLIYETPCRNITEPSAKLNRIPLPWRSLLNSGISSLLFEHKNYPEYKEISSYTLFANGNYSVINQKTLSIANKFLFGHKIILNEIYRWALPYYQEAFSLLSTEEQQELFQQLEIAEKYISVSIKHQSVSNYENWLKEKKITEDEKIIGFLKRRCMKKQWTLNDCRYWLTKIRKDFSPLLKNSQESASHYQLIEKVLPNLLVVCNHQGDFYITDSQYHLLDSQSFRFIVKKKNELNAYRTKIENDFRVYHLQFHKDFGYLEKYPTPHWNHYSTVNDSLWQFYTTEYTGIYDNIKKRTIIDSCKTLTVYEDASIFIAESTHTAVDTFYDIYGIKQIRPTLTSTGHLIYSIDGKMISNMEVLSIPYDIYDENGNTVSNKQVYSFYMTDDYQFFIFRNNHEKVGVINRLGNIIIPFQYRQIDISEDRAYFLAIDEQGEKTRYRINK